jgi:hypothetical protein
MGNVLERPLKELLLLVAHDLGQAPVYAQPAAGDTDLRSTDGSVFEGGPETFFALTQDLLDPTPFCDIVLDTNEVGQPTLLVVDGRDVQLVPERRPVLTVVPQDHPALPLFSQRYTQLVER